jgi:hypothetical protein
VAEDLIFNILAKDSASSGFTRAGRAAAAASDDVLGLARRLDEVSKKSATARVELSGNKDAMAQLDKLDLKLLETGRRVVDPKVSINGAAKASVQISDLDAKLDGLTARAAEAEAATGGAGSGGGLSGVSGLGALIGAGVLLSPVIATLATGLAGFGAAAYGAAAPIEKAAQATGGLQKNMHTLNPEQQELAKGVLGLGKQYDAFQKTLQPEVLSVFGKGIRLAGDLMREAEPVAKATGIAVGGLLSQVDAEFKSGTWQQFFGFMVATAAPDMKLLSNAFVEFMQVLPELLKDLQPVAMGLLQATDDTLKLTDAAIRASEEEHNLAMAANNSSGWLGKLAHAAGQAVGQLLPGVPAAQKLWQQLSKQADASSKSATSLGSMGDALDHSAASTHKMDYTSSVMAATLANFVAPAAKVAGERIAVTAAAVTKLMDAQQKSLSTQTAYAGDLVTAANDAHALEQALKKSGDEIGLHTQAQRNSFGAANTYITDLGNTATQAYSSGKGVNASIKAISQGLPILDQAKTKNRAYWTEVSVLVGWLHKLQNIKMINQIIHVSGTGQWSIAPNKELPGGTAGGPFAHAAGWRVPGYGGGDRWPAMLEGGESVVPKHLTPAVAPLLKSHGVPGFAGGVIGHYGSSDPGLLGAWTSREDSATLKAIDTAVAAAVRTGIAAARSSSHFGHAGPGGGAPLANAALARRMFPGENFSAWNYVAMRESGWNQFALNPSSGAYGIAQALPPTKYPFAGQAAGGSNPAAQISWMEGYMQSRYGGAVGAAAHEQAFNWYDRGGFIPVGHSLAVNNTGRPERVLSGAQERSIEALLRELIGVVRRAPAATGHAMAEGLQGTARNAGARGMYSARGAWA